jgi:hypothetical protein
MMKLVVFDYSHEPSRLRLPPHYLHRFQWVRQAIKALRTPDEIKIIVIERKPTEICLDEMDAVEMRPSSDFTLRELEKIPGDINREDVQFRFSKPSGERTVTARQVQYAIARA